MSWPLVRVRDIAVAHYGKALKKEHREEAGSYDVFGSSGKVGYHTAPLIDKPTLVVGRKGSVGEITWAPNGGWVIDTAYFLELPNPKIIDLRYLFYTLKRANLAQRTITTSIPGLNRDDFYDTEIPLPPLTEQKRIAAILDKADAVRRKRQQAIQLTNDFLKSLFLNNGLSPLSVKIPENAEIKPGWKWVKLTDVARLESGHTPSRKMDEYWNGDVNWLSLKDIKNIGSMYIYDTSDKPTQLGIDNSSARLLPAGTVALCRTASVGKCVILGREMATSQDFVDWVCSDQITPEFLYTVIRCSSREFDKLKQGSTHKTIYMPIVKEFCILLPPISIQKKISRIMAWVENRLITLKENEADCAHLFKSLSQEAFAGKL